MLAVAGILLTVAVIVTASVFFMKQGEGNFTPPPFEENVKKGAPLVNDSDAQYTRAAIGEENMFSMCLCPLYKNGSATIYFSSDIGNTAYLLIKLYDEDGNLIGQSGLVNPGEYVERITISMVPTEDTEISARVLTYEPETYYSMGTVNGTLKLRVVE